METERTRSARLIRRYSPSSLPKIRLTKYHIQKLREN